jgi:hypothetical protein
VKEEFEDFNGVIHKLMKHRQHNGHKSTKGEKRSTKQTHKTKDRVTRTPIKTGCEHMFSERVSSSCSTSGTHRER